MTDEDELNLADRPLAKRKLKALQAARVAGRESVPSPSRSPSPSPSAPAGAAMVDVGAKPVVHREAVAEGFLRLQPATLAAIRSKAVKKGDPLLVGQVAGIQAAKATPTLLPLCHPIPIASVDVGFEVVDDGVVARVRVTADWKTGVEMEALTAVTVALLTVWDMTKYLEKDAAGQYPVARLGNVHVVEKRKS